MNSQEPPRTLRERQRQERQELILLAAEEVFAEKGYHDTSMDEIAAHVGIGAATIYLHFSSKEDLMVAAIIERDFQKVSQHIAKISQSEDEASQKLMRIFHYLVESDFFRRRVNIFYSTGNTIEFQRVLEARRANMYGSAQTFATALRVVFEQGLKAGEFHADLSVEAMMKTFVALMRYYSTADALLLDLSVPMDDFIKVYFQGIRKT